jgi:tetratricopeptide (TPR) repeat protein
VLNDLGQDEEAEQILLASLKLKVTYEALNSLGAMRAYQGRDPEAAGYYEQAIALSGSDYVLRLNLGDSYRRMGRSREAADAYRAGQDLALAELKENPRKGYTRAVVAYFAARLGDRRRAYDEISQALHFSPNDNKVFRRAVLTYEALGERETALEVSGRSTKNLLLELNRQPDLADFRDDIRFIQLLARTTER